MSRVRIFKETDELYRAAASSPRKVKYYGWLTGRRPPCSNNALIPMNKKPRISSDVLKRARRVRMVLMDVDGVLTDGRLFYVPDGQGGIGETKGFDSHDGLSMRWLKQFAGIRVGWISGRESAGVVERARILNVDYVHQNHLSKLEPYQEVLRDSGIPEDQIAYVGDDFSDAVLMLRVGLPLAVANARPEIKKIARYVTSRPGGRGAMREVVELILRAQGHWDAVLAKWSLRKQ